MTFVHSTLVFFTAKNIGDLPTMSNASTSAPVLIKILAISGKFLIAAQCRAVNLAFKKIKHQYINY